MSYRLAPSLLLALLLAGAPAWADVSREEAATSAQQATGGRVLSVDKSRMGNRAVWRGKVVTAGGEVRVVMIDATTGRPI